MGELGIDRFWQRRGEVVDPLRDFFQTRDVLFRITTAVFVADDGETFAQRCGKIGSRVLHRS